MNHDVATMKKKFTEQMKELDSEMKKELLTVHLNLGKSQSMCQLFKTAAVNFRAIKVNRNLAYIPGEVSTSLTKVASVLEYFDGLAVPTYDNLSALAEKLSEVVSLLFRDDSTQF